MIAFCLFQTVCVIQDEAVPPSPIRDFSAAGENTAWVVTTHGKLIRIGADSPAEEAKLRSVNQVYFLNESRGWAFDATGRFWNTFDGGRNWSQSGALTEDPTSPYGSQLIFFDERHGWLRGSFTVWSTEDGGETWSKIYPNEEFSYENLGGDPSFYFPLNEKAGWLSMGNGKVLRTSDGGKSWQNVGIGNNATIYSVYAFDENECFAPAFERTGIYHTTDGGKNWEQILRPKEREGVGIYSISFPTRTTGWAVGIRFVTDPRSKDKLIGVTLKTIDGGKSWFRDENEFYKNPFREVKFSSERNGWLRSANAIYFTSDAGTNWTKIFEIN